MKLDDVEIISFNKKYAQDFYDLNVEWLKKYFYVEPYDEKILSNPKKYIIDLGGYIFFAKYMSELSLPKSYQVQYQIEAL